MNTKHTPGPWETTDGVYITHGECRVLVASAYTTGNNKYTRRANAELIASAPALYAIASALLDVIRKTEGVSEANSDETTPWEELFDIDQLDALVNGGDE